MPAWGFGVFFDPSIEKKESDMNRLLMASATGVLLMVAGCSQPYGMRHGMMDGDEGYGYGGRGMGPGMMRGEGPGPAYGHRGYGMQPDMMPGHGMGGAMMMGGYGLALPDLTNEQRTQIAEIQKEFGRKQWALMGQMHEQRWQSGDALRGGQLDEQAARKAYDTMAAVRKQMFENSLEARKRINSLLTPQQREKLRSRPAGQ
jgi:Spy/CpxP family protein refolding chaperone